jgi:hypothetical protein
MGAVTIAVLMLGGICASSASATDEVWINNPTSTPFTEESLCVLVGVEPCPAGWRQGAILAAGRSNPGLELSVRVTATFEVKFTDEWHPSGASGNFHFQVIDPVVGPVNVQCWGDVPGYSCSVSDGLYAYFHQSGSSTGLGATQSVEALFAGGVATVSRSGIASVPVESYGTQQHGSVRERVVLRSKGGAVIGSGEQLLRFGQKTDIEVKLSRSVAHMVAAGKSPKVQASVTHANGTKGTGQTTTISLTRLAP